MPRRRLRLNRSDDEEEEEEQSEQLIQRQPPSETSAVSNRPETLTPPNPNFGEPLTISDDDFLDVAESFTPPSPPSITPQATVESSPIGDYLLRLGLKLKREWLNSCVQGLETLIPGFMNLDVASKAKLCFERFLLSDMNCCGGGILPDNVDSMHLVDLKGPFILQVDEIVNISCPLKGRYQDAGPGIKRCLKLSMTDGSRRVFGMEYRPIADLHVLAPAGLKVVICNIHIRRGLFMLVPESLEVLGGLVEDLEAARQRLVNEVNKPPRGKRTKTGVVPPLATRATAAAWPLNGANAVEATNSLTSHTASPLSADQRGHTMDSYSTVSDQRIVEDHNIRIDGVNAMFNRSSDVALDVVRMHIDSVALSRENAMSNSNSNSNAASDVENIHMVEVDVRVQNSHNITAPDIEHIHMIDAVEHPLLPSGDQEVPFTYLVNMSAKWAATKDKVTNIRGTIKCFLTGVKSFQYKQRTTYELCCYVDDGSIICEVLLDHNVVQKQIGHSPQEVTDALSSPNKQTVSGMKETMRQFQAFLTNFEGMMVIEMNKTSSLPVAVEMTKGCPVSDAWLLLRRLVSTPTAG